MASKCSAISGLLVFRLSPSVERAELALPCLFFTLFFVKLNLKDFLKCALSNYIAKYKIIRNLFSLLALVRYQKNGMVYFQRLKGLNSARRLRV
jgi:hypothetical protein